MRPADVYFCMMRMLLSVLLAVLGVGCAVPEADTVWHGDRGFTADQRADIEASLAWLTANAGAPAYDVVWDATGSCARCIVRADMPKGTHGDSDAKGHVRIDVWQGADRVGVIVAHELTHVAGATHHDGEGLMNSRQVPAKMVWTDEDRHVTTAWGPR